MTKKFKSLTRIQPESVQFDSKTRIDKEKGIVYGCKILGMESRHGYRYTRGAMKGAIQLYEGARVNVDHPDRKTPGASRSYRDRFGSFRNVHFVEGDGLRGNFHYNKKHAVTEQFEYDAEHDPANCGFSHNASGPLVRRDGGLVCESIEAVRSVDLVADAATTNSLFEGKERMKIKKVAKPKLKFNRATLKKRLMEGGFKRRTIRALLEDIDASGAPSGGGASASPSSVDSVLGLLKPILENPGISVESSIKQVNKVLKALKDMIPGGSEKDKAGSGAGADPVPAMEDDGDDEEADEDDRLEADPDDDADDDTDDDDTTDERPARKKTKPAKSDREILKRLSRLEAREEKVSVTELCTAEGFKPTDKQMNLLLQCDDDDTRKDLIESWQEVDGSGRRIRSKGKSRDFIEGSGGKPIRYKDAKDWAAELVD